VLPSAVSSGRAGLSRASAGETRCAKIGEAVFLTCGCRTTLDWSCPFGTCFLTSSSTADASGVSIDCRSGVPKASCGALGDLLGVWAAPAIGVVACS
jgi:hypothetical protein